jgi:hypothetical protein
MNEIHRIACDTALVQIVTPHLSSLDSWSDPTHRWHLSSRWHTCFTEGYLSAQVAMFEHVQTDVLFGKGLGGWISRGLIALAGLDYWERRLAFVWRARNIRSFLRVRKNKGVCV